MAERIGVGDYQYELVPEWGQVPNLGKDLQNHAVVSGVACDSQSRVYVAVRDLPYPETLSGAILVFDRDGKFLHSFGEDLFTTPHLLYITPDDVLFYTDATDHTVHKFSPSGELLMTLGGYEMGPGERPIDRFKTTSAPGEPFNRPTKVVPSQSGDLFVSDGYGQNRVHRLTAEGEVIASWGETGKGPGQFELPHSLNVDKNDRVFVLDRPNNRCEIFNANGEYLEEWGNLRNPNDMVIDENDVIHMAEGRGVLLLTLEGERIGHWAAGPCHGMWIDSRGDLYLAMLSNEERLRKYTRV